MDKREMTEAFLLKKDKELKEKTLQVVEAIINAELQIKDIKASIKEIKEEAKADGVAIKEVMKTLNLLKKELKTSDVEKAEINGLTDFFNQEPKIIQMLQELVTNN